MINRKNIFLAVFLFLLLSSCERDPLERFSVVYEVEFVGTWNATSHPTDFPIDPHFSPFVVVSHLPNSRLFIEGLNASEGLKQVAETGSTSTLEEELQFFINTGEGLDVAVGDRLDSPGSSTKIQLGMERYNLFGQCKYILRSNFKAVLFLLVYRRAEKMPSVQSILMWS